MMILSNILAFKFFFIFSKVLAVLDWELSTLGEDFKYYENFSYANSMIYKFLIFGNLKYFYTAVFELRICLLLRVETLFFHEKWLCHLHKRPKISTNIVNFG